MDVPVAPFGSVTVFGGASLDSIGRSDAALVMGASNPGSVRRLPGGVGFNVANVLARLGLTTRLVSRIGPDLAGQSILDAARTAGIDTTGLVSSSAMATASYHATLDNDGNLIVGIADMKICTEISPSAIGMIATEPKSSDLWVVDANLPEDTLAFLAEEARHAGRQLAALSVSPAKAVRLLAILDKVAYLFANRREAAALLGLDPRTETPPVAWLAAELAGPRSTRVIVTDGGEPLAAATSREQRTYAPFRAAVRAVNGAGDALAAGTLRGLAGGHALNDAIRFGLAAASITLEAGSVLTAELSEDALAERMGSGSTRATRQQIAS